MASVKSAISFEKPLFERTEQMAREKKISRSRVVNLALRDFFSRDDERAIAEKLDAVYGDAPPDPAEKARLDSMRRHHGRLMKGQW